MNTKINITTYIFITFFASQLLAQSDINDKNLIHHPEVEVIIGLNQPIIQHEIQFTDSDVIDVIINNIKNNDVKNDDLIEDLEDLLDALEDLDDPPTEPDKEELILVKVLQEVALNIYPNPANDFINVQLSEADNYQIEIYDLIGNKVLSENHVVEFGAELTFDLNNFQTGIYVMNIISQKATIIKKFAIKH